MRPLYSCLSLRIAAVSKGWAMRGIDPCSFANGPVGHSKSIVSKQGEATLRANTVPNVLEFCSDCGCSISTCMAAKANAKNIQLLCSRLCQQQKVVAYPEKVAPKPKVLVWTLVFVSLCIFHSGMVHCKDVQWCSINTCLFLQTKLEHLYAYRQLQRF